MKSRTAKLSQGEFTSPLSDNFKRKMLQGFPLRCRFGRRRGQGPGGLRGPPGPLQPLPPAWPTRAARPVLRELPSLRSGDLPPRRAIALRLQWGRGGMGAAQTPGGVKPLWPQGSEYLITYDKPTKTMLCPHYHSGCGRGTDCPCPPRLALSQAFGHILHRC